MREAYKLPDVEVSHGWSAIVCRDEEVQPASVDIRNKAQNALLWEWNNQIARHTKYKPDFVHGLNKLQILLPMYKSWGGKKLERANFIEDVLSQIAYYSTKVGVAYDMVRSRDLSIPKMAEYLSAVQRENAQNGIILESNSDLEFKNLMMYAEKKA